MHGNSSFWGRYDIRGIVGDLFDASQYRQIGRAYGEYVTRHGNPDTPRRVAVGYDARLHSPQLTDALIEGLTQAGLEVIQLGMVTSPIVYFSDQLHGLKPEFPALAGAMMVTASHNPPEYNGVKFTFNGHTLDENGIQALKGYYDTQEDSPAPATPAAVSSYDIIPDYLDWMAGQFGNVGRGIKIVVDSGNATAGPIAPQLLRRLGCEVVELYSEPDGTFPNHPPDPLVHKNLKDLMAEVKATGANVGVAFDGDSDRMGVVDDTGNILTGDLMVLFFADDLLKEHPGAKVIFDIKSTQNLFAYLGARNGQPILSPSGHAFIKARMREEDILLGGELSGHFFFRDRHWGYDDAIYAACRMIESFAHRRSENPDYKMSDFAASLPQTQASEEIRVHCTKAEGTALIEQLTVTVRETPTYFGPPVEDILTMDGLRINMKDGFILIRHSNTEPSITLRYETADPALYKSIGESLETLTRSMQQPVLH